MHSKVIYIFNVYAHKHIYSIYACMLRNIQERNEMIP